MKNVIVNVSLLALSILFVISILEMGARVYYSDFSFQNFLLVKRDLHLSAYPSEIDKQLGWAPKKGNHHKNAWNTKVTILDDGIRSNGNNLSIEDGKIILAVGDSFTFGDQVSDSETWPARLEMKSNARVINGGVFGYGVDQSYLRMQALASKYHPDIIIFSFIPDDIHRCELSERASVPKPYFNISGDDDLVLINEHIPPQFPETSLGIFKNVMGYSFLVNKLMSRAFPEYWLQVSWRPTKVHSKGAEVTCRIFGKLKDYAQKEKIKLYILVQYGKYRLTENRAVIDEVIPCIDQNILELVDLHSPLANLKKSDIKQYKSLYHGHMSREGNEFVASLLLKAITNRNGITIRDEKTQGRIKNKKSNDARAI